MNKVDNRNYLLDNLKVILIFSVVFGHVIEFYIKDNSYLMGIYIFIYIFHMPLFVFVSGYFSKKLEKIKRNAIKNLLIPYIIFNMIWYGSVYIVTKENMFSVLYPGWTLWYLLSLFFWRMSLKYLVKVKHILIISFVAGLIIGILPRAESLLSISRTIVFLPFFLLGYYAKENHIERIKSINKILSILGIIFFIAVAIYVAKNNLLDYRFLYNSQSYSTLGVTKFYGVYLRAILYVGAILFSICVINIIPRKKMFFSYIGKSTMTIYVFHIYFVVLVYFFIPKWNMGIIRDTIIVLSPILIIYILAKSNVGKLYDGIFYPVNKGISTGKKTYEKYKGR